jgi:phospholipase A2
MFQAKPGRGFLLATSLAYTAALTYSVQTRPRARLLADSSASANADFEGKPTVITSVKRASQSGHVDETGKQRAFVAEQRGPKPPSQIKEHGAAYTNTQNAAKSLVDIPNITSIFASFGSFDIAGLTESLTKAVVPAWVLALPNAIHKLQDELSLAPWSVSWEIWEQAHDPQINPEIVWDARVRISNDLCVEEQQFLAKRKPNIAKALARYIGVPESEVHPDDVPVIAMCGSGGGLRALVAGTSSYFSAQQAGLFDCATYTAGVSGSCWLQALYYSSIGQTNYGRLIDHFKDRLGVHIAFPPAALSLLSQAPTNKFLLSGIVEKLKGVPDYSLVDSWYQKASCVLAIGISRFRISVTLLMMEISHYLSTLLCDTKFRSRKTLIEKVCQTPSHLFTNTITSNGLNGHRTSSFVRSFRLAFRHGLLVATSMVDGTWSERTGSSCLRSKFLSCW